MHDPSPIPPPPPVPATAQASRGLPTIVIGLIVAGAALAVLVGLVLALLLPALARARGAARAAIAGARAKVLVMEVEQYRSTRGSMPSRLEDVVPDPALRADPWEQSYELRVVNEDPVQPVYEIWSAGPDRAWQTGDDFVAATSPAPAPPQQFAPPAP